MGSGDSGKLWILLVVKYLLSWCFYAVCNEIMARYCNNVFDELFKFVQSFVFNANWTVKESVSVTHIMARQHNIIVVCYQFCFIRDKQNVEILLENS